MVATRYARIITADAATAVMLIWYKFKETAPKDSLFKIYL